jgi:endonuclease YncB( thermonuclease family)
VVASPLGDWAMDETRGHACACMTALAAAVVLALAGPAGAGTIGGAAEIIDGDGLMIGPVVVRIHGIDAPEVGQACNRRGGGTWRCDEAASALLEDLAGGRDVECEALDRDQYGRVIARCWVDGIDLGEALVADGLAWAFTRFSDDYVAVEEKARAAGLGIWQAPTEPAWDFRADRWARAVEAAPGDCPIKGNISRQGERIYHTPWSPWYSRTQIDETAGERWFCDEAEAIAAGWRAPRR